MPGILDLLSDPKFLQDPRLAMAAGLLSPTPNKSFGQGLGQGLGAYQNQQQAQSQQQQQALMSQAAQQKIKDAEQQAEQRKQIQSLLSGPNGFLSDGVIDQKERQQLGSLLMGSGNTEQGLSLLMPKPEDSLFSKINPNEYTQESVAQFVKTKNYADLRAKPEMADAENPFAKINPDNFTNESVNLFEKSGTYSDLVSKPNATPSNVFEHENVLRDEHTNQSGEFIKVRDSYNRVQAAVSDPSAAGDLALVFNFMKMLDPSSVVRESEFATAENSRGVPATIRNWHNKVLSGERMPPEQRADFLNRAGKLYDQQQLSQRDLDKKYTALSERNKLDPNNVVIDYDTVNKFKSMSKSDLMTIDPTKLTPKEQQQLLEVLNG